MGRLLEANVQFEETIKKGTIRSYFQNSKTQKVIFGPID
jgi:hypothetical protein